VSFPATRAESVTQTTHTSSDRPQPDRELSLPQHDTIDDEQPLHRLLGQPALIQSPDPRDSDPQLRLVLQIDSDDSNGMIWGDYGRLYVWMHADDLAARRFQRAILHFDQ
jgi:uncharacterized protein YwqG